MSTLKNFQICEDKSIHPHKMADINYHSSRLVFSGGTRSKTIKQANEAQSSFQRALGKLDETEIVENVTDHQQPEMLSARHNIGALVIPKR